MQSMPPKIVYAAGGIVALAAVLGVYFGVSRSLTSTTGLADEAGTIVPAVTPVAAAKPILTPAVTLDEAEVRRLAREEAQALISKSAPRKAASNDDDADTGSADTSPPTPATVPLTVAKPAVPAPPG